MSAPTIFLHHPILGNVLLGVLHDQLGLLARVRADVFQRDMIVQTIRCPISVVANEAGEGRVQDMLGGSI